MRRTSLCILLAMMCFGQVAAHAGANHSARAWVTWDRAGLIPALYTTHLDSANVYVHLEGAPDIQALAVYLSYSFEGDSTTTLVSATPDNQSGWAQQQSAAASFLGDSTYNWTIHFSAGDEKAKIKYAVQTHLHPDTLNGSVWIQSALAQDGNGEVDTIRVVGAAVIHGADLPAFSVPTDSLPGMAIVTFAPGLLATGTRMVFPEDIQTASLRDSLVAMTGYSVGQHVFPSAPDGETVRIGVNGDTVSCIDESRSVVLKLSDTTPLAVLLTRLSALQGVVSVCPVAALANLRQPNDPSYGQQWYLQSSGTAALGAPLAWDSTIGQSNLLIGIIDSGVDYHHPDLDPNQDQSRVIRGYDYGDGDRDVFDDTPPNDQAHGHGTSVTGIAGALTDNGVGVAGIMWQGKVLMEKSLQSHGICPTACFSYHPSYAVAAGVDDAVRRGARAINISIGYPGIVAPDGHGWYLGAWLIKAAYQLLGNDPVAVATYNAYKLGSVVCAAAGNDGNENINLPAAYPWVMCVGASNQDGNRSSYSDYGSRLDLIAPGDYILTTTMMDKLNGYDPTFSGTSAAAPMVTGAAALVCGESDSRHAGLSNEDVMNLLKIGARPIGGSGRTDAFGYGYLDVSRSLARLRPPYRIVRGSAVTSTSTMVVGTHQITMIGNGGLPGSVYWGDTYEVRNHVAFCGTLSEDAAIWARERESRGWSAANPNSELPYAQIENVARSGFDVVTFVYYIRQDIAGADHFKGWWPCPPSQAAMAYTAVTRSVLNSVDITGPEATCQGTWNASACGGEGELGYEWFSRTPGGVWSGILGTSASLSMQLPGHDLDLKVVTTSNGVAVADSVSVHYVTCTVDVQPLAAPIRLNLSIGPNPIVSSVRLTVALPRRGPVKLEVFDVGGRLVSTLYQGQMEAGIHEFAWGPNGTDGRRRAGLFFARLVTPDGSRRTRLVVLR